MLKIDFSKPLEYEDRHCNVCDRLTSHYKLPLVGWVCDVCKQTFFPKEMVALFKPWTITTRHKKNRYKGGGD